MKTFMDEDFLLQNVMGKRLYERYARDMPIIDYHCHIDPKEIYEDRVFDNLTQVWLGADHYKWRLMRSNGVEERYITGDATDFEKFQKWAQTLERAIGNPLYHWSHLELKRYFGYEGILTAKTAEQVWNLCNEKLQSRQYSVRNLILRSKVEILCTTDDPADSLQWHKLLREDDSFPVQVRPAFRPDRAMNLKSADYLDYLKELETASKRKIISFADLISVLERRMDYFAELGCVLADHGLTYVAYEPAGKQEIEEIFARRLVDGKITELDMRKFQTVFMQCMAMAEHQRDWTMQLHYGCKRNNNSRLFEQIGADTGFDCIHDHTPAAELCDFLDSLDQVEQLPRTILYSLNPADNAAIGTILGCFQNADAVGKIQQGSAWWFNDHKRGMEEQLTSLASRGLLANFVGMLTDSRSFLSYTRHEYFRRIVCNLIGAWVEQGEYPDDEELLGKIVRGISYENALRYFKWK